MTSPLINIQDIPFDSAKECQLDDGRAIFIVNKDGEFFAYENHCPHLGIELNWNPDQFLDAEGSLIQCSTHGALFLIESGECVAGPCQGQHLKSIAIQIDSQGDIYFK